jgi:hypothetical protein
MKKKKVFAVTVTLSEDEMMAVMSGLNFLPLAPLRPPQGLLKAAQAVTTRLNPIYYKRMKKRVEEIIGKAL